MVLLSSHSPACDLCDPCPSDSGNPLRRLCLDKKVLVPITTLLIVVHHTSYQRIQHTIHSRGHPAELSIRLTAYTFHIPQSSFKHEFKCHLNQPDRDTYSDWHWVNGLISNKQYLAKIAEAHRKNRGTEVVSTCEVPCSVLNWQDTHHNGTMRFQRYEVQVFLA